MANDHPKKSYLKIENTVNYSKKTGFFKEKNVGFSVQIHSVTLKKPGLKKGILYEYTKS